MTDFLLIVVAIAAAYFAYKYYRQRNDIRLLAESLSTRTSILTHTQEFRGNNANWSALLDELNALISDIQRLDKQNSDRLQQIETTLESMREGVLILDRDNYILLANSVLQSAFPALRDKVGQRMESVLRGSEFLEFISQVKSESIGEGRELVFMEGNRKLWMEISGSRLEMAEEGNSPWYLLVFHNITKLKELESMRQQFVANASHELKTPVSVIKGYAETLVADHDNMEVEDRGRFLDVIQRHSERLSLLINDLLSLSRLESDKLQLDWSHSDLYNWIREASFEIGQNMKQKGRELILELPDEGEARTRFDALKLRQAIDNLVENASKYTPDNGAIRLGAGCYGDQVEIWVKDEGPGVPDKDVDRIFERFYRVDKGRSRDTGGTGLGLSIVKHIVDCHEGQVAAENMEGKGLKVAIRLPLVESETKWAVV